MHIAFKMKSLLTAYIYFNLPWMVLMQSLLDGFTVANDRYFPFDVVINEASTSLKACTFVCIIHECSCFSFDGATCRMHHQCQTTSSGTSWTSYLANSNRKILKDPPNGLDHVFTRYPNVRSQGHYYLIGPMDEKKCMLYGLMNNFDFVVHRTSYNYCYVGTRWEDIVADNGWTDFLRPLIWSCIPGSSCYAVINTRVPVSFQKAEEDCKAIGGQLAAFETEEEYDALGDFSPFNSIMKNFWVDITRYSDAWKWGSDSALTWHLPTTENSEEEGRSMLLLYSDEYKFKPVPKTHLHFGLCEIPSVTTALTWKQDEDFNLLNDGSLTTCYQPERESDGAASVLQTRNLNYKAEDDDKPEQSVLVKLIGTGFSQCQQLKMMMRQKGSGVKVELSSGQSPPVLRRNSCIVYEDYVWEGMTSCFYQCSCGEDVMCDKVYLKMPAMVNISVCEFQVI